MNTIEIIKMWLIYSYAARNCNKILDVMINWDCINRWKGEKFINDDEIVLDDLFHIPKKYDISITALIEYCLLSIKDKLNNEDPNIFNLLLESINNDLEKYKIAKITQQQLITNKLFLDNVLNNDDPAYGYEIIESILPNNPEIRMKGVMMYIAYANIKASYEWLNEGLDTMLNEFHLSKTN